MIRLLFALVVRHKAAPWKYPSNKYEHSSSITGRKARSSFFPMPRFLSNFVVDVERHHCQGFWPLSGGRRKEARDITSEITQPNYP